MDQRDRQRRAEGAQIQKEERQAEWEREQTRRQYEKEREENREAERDRRLEELLERTRATGAGILDDFSHSTRLVESRRREKVERFRPMKVDEDVETYFSSFEAHMTTYRAEKEEWTKCLAPLLDAQLKSVYISLDEDSRRDYDVVKEPLYYHFRVTQATYRSRLDQLRRQPGETWSTAGERGKCLARRWLSKCKTVEEAADLIAEDAIVKCMLRQILIHVRDRKTETMKESVAVADDFMSVRRWNYDVVQEPNRTAVEPRQKEEKVCHSADQTGRDRPASPRTERRDKSDGRHHYDKLRDYPKDNHASCVSSEKQWLDTTAKV